MKRSVNVEIAVTHILTRKKQMLVAALGVTLGVGIFLFMNSLSSGFSAFSRGEIFKVSPHIKIYQSDEISTPLQTADTAKGVVVIVNPQITTQSKQIINPEALLAKINAEPYVSSTLAQVSFDVFYNKGKAQVRGTGNGVNILAYDAMFALGKYMVAGSMDALNGNLNGIIIGSGIAEKLNLGISDNITLTSSYNVVKSMKVVGIFTSGSGITDDSKSYVNISTAQQFLTEGPAYVSNIYVRIPDPDKSEIYMQQLQQLTPYRVEDWKTTNADLLAGDKTRSAMMGAISLSILIVAAFGIYNILSSTIAQKINDIAILKATGFSGGDVVRIFILEAVIMGLLGTIMGLLLGSVLIGIMSQVYMGGPVGYFPIHFEPRLFIQSFVLGLVITICAGYFPARKAARVDPVEIFRK
jgi:lipoprotein-releasing system permease protein